MNSYSPQRELFSCGSQRGLGVGDRGLPPWHAAALAAISAPATKDCRSSPAVAAISAPASRRRPGNTAAARHSPRSYFGAGDRGLLRPVAALAAVLPLATEDCRRAPALEAVLALATEECRAARRHRPRSDLSAGYRGLPPLPAAALAVFTAPVAEA